MTMARVPLVEVENMTPTQKEQYDRFPSNLSRGLLLLDDRLAGALPNLANALRASSLDPKRREAVILRVAALHNSAYERMQHLEQARKVGWSDAEIVAIEAGSAAVHDPALATLLHFAEACVQGASVPQQTFAAAHELLSARDLATVVVLVGHYMMVARFIGVLEIPLDAKPDSWQQEH